MAVRSRRVGVTVAVGALAAAAVALTVTTNLPAYAIAHGTPVPEGQYGFATKLTMTNIPRPDGTHYNSGCSAALIAPQWIITAGHCFHDVNRNRVSGPIPYATVATIGRTDDSDATGHVIALVADYQSPTNDIAIAQLATPVYDVTPMSLSTVAPQAGDVLRITGWGSLDDVNPVPATHLQTGEVTITAVDSATLGVTAYRPAPDTSACLYDSGAPYFSEPAGGVPQLVAVESSGPDCPHSQVETTARVDAVVPWVSATIQAAEPAGPTFTVDVTQACVNKAVAPNLMMQVDQVTVTFNYPHYRPPNSASYTINFRSWLRPQGRNDVQPIGPRTWVNADLNRPGWVGQGSVVMAPGVYQVSSSFWLRPSNATPSLLVVGTDQPFAANNDSPAYGMVQHTPAGCTF